MAEATKNSNPDKKHVAVIGDGAMTAGMAFEALSHIGPVSYTHLTLPTTG